MIRTVIPAKALVLVCDAGKALFFRNEGNTQALNLVVIDEFSQKVPRTSELGTDRPGRVHDSHDGSRSAVAATDRHRQGEVAFLHRVGVRLDELVRSGSIRHVVIVAPPPALGMLLPDLSHNVKSVLKAAVARDLVKLPTARLERKLASLAELPEND